MKELKFNCPSCGQHIQCDWRHAGENVPCPGCATLIRVPLDGDLTDVPSPQPEDNPFSSATGDTEKVSYISAKSANSTEQKKPTASAESAAATSISPVTANPTLPTAPDKEPPAMAHAAQASELRCVCPICQSELLISVAPCPSLEEGAPHTVSGTREVSQTSAEQLPSHKRERQIADARERALHPTEKPRLDRILGGGVTEPSSPSEKK